MNDGQGQGQGQGRGQGQGIGVRGMAGFGPEPHRCLSMASSRRYDCVRTIVLYSYSTIVRTQS